MLTSLGILLGFFVIIIKGGHSSIESNLVIYTGVGTSISMFISGFSGSYLSERAEQKKIHMDINRAMGKFTTDSENEGEEKEVEQEEIEKAMLVPLKKKKKGPKKLEKKKEEKEEVKTLFEKAESFAGKIVATVNGGAPFCGGLVPLIPFFLVVQATFITFIFSFIIIVSCIVFLGIFLGIISDSSIIKMIIQMVAAFAITVTITIVLLP